MITGAKVKTDKRDAFTLARLLRLDAIPEAYIYPREQRVLRDLLRKRHKLVARRAVEYCAIRRMLYQHGHGGFSINSIKRFSKEQVTEFFQDPYVQCDCLFVLDRIQLLSRQIRILEEGILSQMEKEISFQLLQTLPVVGKILALSILLETGDIERFPSHRHFCSYARVVLGIAESSGSVKRSRESKQENAYLKNAFSQAASLAVQYNSTVRKFWHKHMARRRSRGRRLISLGIVAHKLAVAAYHILKKQEPFREELMFGKYCMA